MRQAAYAVSFLIILLGLVSIVGCGDVDVMDEPEDSYTYSMELMDNDDEGALTIDIIQDVCGEGNSTTPEDYTDLFAIVTVNVASTAAGLSLNHYRLEYIPLSSPDSAGNLVAAPTVGSSLTGYVNVDIASGETATFPITMMTTDTKYQMAVDSGIWDLGWFADPFTLRYTMRVTLYFEDYGGEEQEFVLEKTAYFTNYDNC